MFKKSLLLVALFCAVNSINGDGASKVVCHYDSRSFIREGKTNAIKDRSIYMHFAHTKKNVFIAHQ